MTLLDYLQNLLTSAGAGVFIFVLIASIEAILPADKQPTGDQKFYAALLLSFLVPAAAYGTLVALGAVQATPEGLFQMIGVAFLVSQTIHRGLDTATGVDSDISPKTTNKR